MCGREPPGPMPNWAEGPHGTGRPRSRTSVAAQALQSAPRRRRSPCRLLVRAGPPQARDGPGHSPSAGKMRAMPVRYAYLGPEGTFTEAALAEFEPSALDGAMPCASIPATLDAVRGGAAERAIVPIENSVE